jgi:hypothetical protein
MVSSSCEKVSLLRDIPNLIHLRQGIIKVISLFVAHEGPVYIHDNFYLLYPLTYIQLIASYSLGH